MRALNGLLISGVLALTIAACGGAATPGPVGPKPVAAGHKAIPAEKKHAIPDNWEEMSDAKKGYSFHVPAGTTASTKSLGGVDFYIAVTPQPHNIEVLVAAWKDKKLSKEDLLKEATEALTALGNTNVAVGNVNEIASDYSLAEMTMVDSNSVKYKTVVLVATDITDNYIMIIGTPEAEWTKNKETLDAMWSSFEMWSGGASGEG